MKKKQYILILFFAVISATILTAYKKEPNKSKTNFQLPYKQAGLTNRQAAAHLLSRFTYGATPGQIDQVINMGLENWLTNQLQAKQPDDSLNLRLKSYETLTMSNADIAKVYPKNGQVFKQAVKDGVIKDSLENINKKEDKKEYKEELKAYMQENGLKPRQELARQLVNQKILRAAYSNNQLQEVLTSFWFNHFNVSLTKNDCANFVTVYERDAIRPNVLGKFETLLLATAKSPAMLAYLDNFKSTISNEDATEMQKIRQERMIEELERQQASDTNMQNRDLAGKIKKAKKQQGLNENYAREVMELHTLGVDGGYTQTDVTQAAKVLTGWTIYPMEEFGKERSANLIRKIDGERAIKQGFVHEGDFLFSANKHDKNEKTVLGTTFPEGGGMEEGVKLMEILAHHPSTAKFICKKIAIRFVSDNPPQSLIDKMVKTFTDKDGDIKQVLITMATAPEFWDKEALREKTKSPFELAISAVRSLDADITMPYQLFNWITKMGEKKYYYQAPTGYPDKGQYWINTGALLNRMNFGLALASQRIPGIHFNLAALNKNQEPESADAALLTYGKILMPERNIEETVKRLTPLLNNPDLEKKIDEAAGTVNQPNTAMEFGSNDEESSNNTERQKKMKENPNKKNNKNTYSTMQIQSNAGSNSMLAQVVGIIIGSPEYQRR